jgi:tetratricopeptide (TPR) repeat protein
MQSLAPPDERTRAAEAIPTPEPASPNDIKLDSAVASQDGENVMSPVIDPADMEAELLPSLSRTADAGKSKSAVDKPDTAAINDAAFGEESQKEPGSVGYGQTTKVALGTFAFHRERGDTYRKASRYAEAAVEYKTALELSPNDTETRTLLAEMYGRIGNEEKAETQFGKAKAQNPSDDRIYYKEGNAYFDEQK